MKNRRWLLSGLLCAVSILAACQTLEPRPSQAPAPGSTAKPTPTSGQVSFAGKTITIIVPSSAGGGTDVAARVYARFLPRHLPGNPSMVVRNIPGGDGLIGVNYAYSARPDGLTVLASAAGRLLAQLVGLKEVKYDFLKMTTLIGVPAGALFVIKSGIVSRAEDLPKAKGLIVGLSSGITAGTITFVSAKELLNIPTEKVMLSYAGVGDARRAFLAGETNLEYETSGALQEFVKPHVDSGEVMLLFQTGLLDKTGDVVKDANLPPIPTLKDLYEKMNGKAPSEMAYEAYNAGVAAGLT